jgi:NAD(P)-dependent dehydrogenase (short-subunit alcohol dehydrogenase family)
MAGRSLVITGGASGIGFATARALVRDGFRVVITSRDDARGAAAATALRQVGPDADVTFTRCDVAREGDVEMLMAGVAERWGRIDALVNNAGPSGKDFIVGPVHEIPSDAFDRAMRIGSYGPFWCCKYALPHMLAAGGGGIVNISAITAARAVRNLGGYALAKAMLDTLTRQIAEDYGSSNIRCNTLMVGTIRPGEGDVSTLPADFDTGAIDAAVARTTMLGRLGRYSDIAGAVRFLLSPAAAFITGSSISIDGGAGAKLLYPDYADAMPD